MNFLQYLLMLIVQLLVEVLAKGSLQLLAYLFRTDPETVLRALGRMFLWGALAVLLIPVGYILWSQVKQHWWGTS
jgi:hypothetical protein